MGENIVKMPVKQAAEETKAVENKKLSYEELENVAQNLSAQNQNLVNKYKELFAKHQELMQNNYFIRLEWLWRVISMDPNKFSMEFVQQCTDEFVELMTPSQEDNKE